MSGVYIPKIEMPESCWDCFACHDGWCIINQKIEGHRTVTHSCPLIPVPDHGRLIDADALKEHFPHDEDWDYPVNTHSLVCETIDDVPTIIPAESEGE